MASDVKNVRLGYVLAQLRRHLLGCYDCKGARKAQDPDSMCEAGRMLVLSAADDFDAVMELRRKAHRMGESIIYACPDLSRHSESYSLTAIPFTVTAVQGELF